MKPLNVLSLFDGISCGRLALERAGIPVANYYASEIDGHTMKVSKQHWPDIIQVGDVTKWNTWDLDWSQIDLIIAGSPCQGFSFCGKQLAFDDPRSKLFFEFAEVVARCRIDNPDVKFMLENVKMKKTNLQIIDHVTGVKGKLINGNLVSAQNRPRYYWANWDFGMPEDRGITFADIEDHGDMVNFVVAADKIDSNVVKTINNNIKSAAFTERRTEEAKRIRREHMKKHGVDFSPRRAKELVARTDGKLNCLTATYSNKEHRVIDRRGHYRDTTPLEWERAQTLPDNYTAAMPKTERYKAIGNGWNINKIAHIFEGLK